LSRLLHGLKTKQTRFARSKIALIGGTLAFSSVASADDILQEGITPATDASQIPAAPNCVKTRRRRDFRAAGDL
jgi:peptide/nickel transport system substrate-binding protein